MARGTVKWFNNAKGYGFILPDKAGEQELFAHYSEIEMEGYKTLRAGQLVAFNIEEGPKGWHAVAIQAANDVDENLQTSENEPLNQVNDAQDPADIIPSD